MAKPHRYRGTAGRPWSGSGNCGNGRNRAVIISFVDEVIEVLRREFEAEEGSFLLRLRGDLEWDRTAFSRLERAMRTACERSQGSEKLDRWLAEGFYEIATWVPVWTSHPNFPRPTPRLLRSLH